MDVLSAQDSIFTMQCMAQECAILGKLATDPDTQQIAEDVDKIMGKVMLSMFVIFHIWFGWRSTHPLRRKDANAYIELLGTDSDGSSVVVEAVDRNFSRLT
jgi:hypothetical protein